MNEPKNEGEDKLSTDEKLIILGLLTKSIYINTFSVIADLNFDTVHSMLARECAEKFSQLDISEVRMRIDQARNVINSYNKPKYKIDD